MTKAQRATRKAMAEHDRLHFWTQFFAYSLLLAVYTVVLGIALAGLVSALRACDEGQSFNRPD
jgi:hypothetical protein